MTDNVIRFPGTIGGGGSDGPVLEQRVTKLETDMARVLGILERLEPRIVELHATSAKQSDIAAVRSEMSAQRNSFKNEFKLVRADIALLNAEAARLGARFEGIDKRLASIPTTWQIVAILATLLIGISGIILATGRYFRP
jgi:chromosome segregation ATPase